MSSAAPSTPPAFDEADDSPGRMLRLLAYPLFFASGAAGLIYEVVWTRMLLATFGAGLYAICAVLAAFMGGLALGSWLLGRASDRMRRPLLAYGVLELSIGVAGLLLPLLLTRIGSADGWAYNAFGQNFALLTAFRFVLAFILLMIPTTLMGATLPVLSRFMVRSTSHLGLHVGWLYSINTFGALAGAFLAGFVLIGRFGVLQSEWTAVGLNVLVALGAFVLAPRTDQPPLLDEPEESAVSEAPAPTTETPAATEAAATEAPAPAEAEATTPAPAEGAAAEQSGEAEATPAATDGEAAAAPAEPPASPATLAQRAEAGIARWVCFTAFASGAVALAAQVLWSRSLVFSFEYLKNTTYAFSAMLTVFLMGLAIGSALIGLFIDHVKRPLRLYGVLLSCIGLAIMGSVTILYYAVDFLKITEPFNEKTNQLSWIGAVGNVMMQSFGVLALPTLLMGMAFPVAARSIVNLRRIGSDVGRLYSFNTLGAILGSVLAGFVIVPVAGLTGGLLLLGLVDLLLGLGTLNQARLADSSRSNRHLIAFSALGGVFAIVVWMGLPQNRGLQPLTTEMDQTVFYKEGSLATVAVLENNVGDRTIYVDGVGVAGTDQILQTDQKSLAHVPMLLIDKPESALTVGFGSGGASYSLQLHDRLKDVHCVEICPTMFDAAPTLKAANHDFFGQLSPWEFALKDPRYEIILDDARALLRYSPRKYSFISTDCTDLRYKSNANLYDTEYFEACRQHLTPDGVVCVWMPLGGLRLDVFKVALRTFESVFPGRMGIFYMANVPTHYILLIGWQHDIKLEWSKFAERIQEPDVLGDLGELYLDDPVKLLSCFITGGEKLSKFLADAELNTQNHPILEFESPKYGYGDRPLIDNLGALMADGVRVLPSEFLDTTGMPPAELERLHRYERALPDVIAGHAAFRELDIEQATLDYMKAAELTPEDLSLRRGLLPMPSLERRVQKEPENFYPVLTLGRSRMLQGKRDEAYDLLVRAERLLERHLERQPSKPLADQLNRVRTWLAEMRQAQERP